MKIELLSFPKPLKSYCPGSIILNRVLRGLCLMHNAFPLHRSERNICGLLYQTVYSDIAAMAAKSLTEKMRDS